MLSFFLHHFQNLKISIIIVLLLSLCLQAQTTLFEQSYYSGLRVNLADLFLPFLGVYILVSLASRQSSWPSFAGYAVWVFLALLIAVMSFALFYGIEQTGVVLNWALYNKYCGFYVLIAYLLLGGWLATNARSDTCLLRTLMQGMCGFVLCILALSVVSLFLPETMGWLGEYSWDGLMANRNAFMVVVIFSIITLEVFRAHGDLLLPVWAHHLFWSILPFFAFYNASRTAWIVGGVCALIIFLHRPFWGFKAILPWLIIGSILAYSSISLMNKSDVLSGRQLHTFKTIFLKDDIQYVGDRIRITMLKDTTELYTQSHPLFGAGLGSYRIFQENKHGSFIDLIDSTPLWLLVETGMLGLLAFATFFAFCLWRLYRAGFARDGPISAAHQALFLFLIAFAVMSVMHELTYTRFLWFAVGLALGVKTVHSTQPYHRP